MANVRFNLKGKKKDKELILLIFRYNSKRLVYSTSQTIPTKFWDDKKMRCKAVKQYPYQGLNNYLDKLEYGLLDAYRNFLVEEGEPTVLQLKNELDIITGKTSKNKNDFFAFVDTFIEERKKLPKYADNTIAKYRHIKTKLLAYQTYTKKPLTFKGMDMDFFYSFTAWLYEKGFSANYVRKIIRTLKTFLNNAKERGINKYNAFQNSKFSVSAERTEHIYLTIDEITKIFKAEIKDAFKAEIRDLFIMACCTGLRFSDFTDISKRDIKKVGNLELIDKVTLKTKIRVVIPIHPYVKTILENRNYKFLRNIENKEFNDTIRQVCKEIGFSEIIQLQKNKGGKQVVLNFEKWEAITSHTGRRSFISNLRKEGVSDYYITKMTGHTTTEQLSNYDKVKLEENALKSSKTDFFKVKLKAI